MPFVDREDFSIHYDVPFPDGEATVVLVQGLGEQLDTLSFEYDLCALFADRGFRVVRIENRDSGLSAPKNESVADYTTRDMAADVTAVIDDAGGGPVHLVGLSLGGYVVRWAAAARPELIASLTVVMGGSGSGSTDGGPRLTPEAVAQVSEFAKRRDRDSFIEQGVETWRWMWGDGYPFPEAQVAERLGRGFDRAFRPEGTARQLKSARMRGLPEAQRNLRCPTLFIHGARDRFFPPDHARWAAAQVPGAELWIDDRMGHALPRALWSTVVDKIAGHRPL